MHGIGYIVEKLRTLHSVLVSISRRHLGRLVIFAESKKSWKRLKEVKICGVAVTRTPCFFLSKSLFLEAKMSLRPNYRADARKQRYKVAVDKVEAHRKREENMVEIRKYRREETLLKKRREAVASALSSQPSSGYDESISLEEKLQSLPVTVLALASDDIGAKEAAVIHLRKMLTIDRNPPIDAVIQSGVVPFLVDFLSMADVPQLQFEAAWALTNIVSGTTEHTKVVIESGALPLFVELLTSVDDNLREQAVWALGNIAGDCAEYRDLVLCHGALRMVLAQFNKTVTVSMIKIATWTLSNFCRGKPEPQLDQVKYALPALEWLLHMQEEEVLADACWALSYISHGPSENIQAVIDAGICPKLVELLSHSSPFVVTPALRTVGKIVTGHDVQTQVVLDNKALARLLHLLTDKQTKRSIIKDTCWTISNVTAGTTEQVQAVINANIFPPLLSLLANAEFNIKREAAWAVSNAIAAGNDEQIRYLAIQGCIKPLCDLLTCQDSSIITICLQGIENILRAGETKKNAGITDVNVYVRIIEDAGGLDKIEDLQTHENLQVYEKSVAILENYLGKEYDDHVLTSMSDTTQQAEVPPVRFNFM